MLVIKFRCVSARCKLPCTTLSSSSIEPHHAAVLIERASPAAMSAPERDSAGSDEFSGFSPAASWETETSDDVEFEVIPAVDGVLDQ